MSDDGSRARIRELEADNARLRRLLERQGSPGGLRHQVRNTLSTVREFVRRSADTGHSVEDYAAHLDGRLDAVLRVQNAIANGPGEGEVSLHALVADEFLAQAIGEGQRASIAGPEITFKPIAAGAFALVLHELAVNAVKFGAMTVPDGMIEVSWGVAAGEDAPLLTWAWTESGLSGLPEEPPRRGFGTEIIERSLSYQINAAPEVRLTPGGLHCTITLPLLPWVGAVTGGSRGAA
ncbi:HWE histidine kinase domain-containing protein [Lichenibacterium dinghuense]|uniref:HWE histidine kinase domain-containing protein n=1 Tax=Lichenibacterium dinghuense TaxID=2895977 RepID=UPI001F3479FD|nr:HWE histidine kinase domain-containing protein [Lichenibacterium sp. 6Y81]